MASTKDHVDSDKESGVHPDDVKCDVHPGAVAIGDDADPNEFLQPTQGDLEQASKNEQKSRQARKIFALWVLVFVILFTSGVFICMNWNTTAGIVLIVSAFGSFQIVDFVEKRQTRRVAPNPDEEAPNPKEDSPPPPSQ